MKFQYYSWCKKDTWQNPMKIPATKHKRDNSDYRCVDCGYPKRFGQKNWLIREGGKLIALAKV